MTDKPNDVQRVLIDAKALISDPAKWCKGRLALDNIGRPVDPGDLGACRFCSVGALHRVCQSDERNAANKLLSKAAGREIVCFNDASTHSKVMAAFDRAIELAGKA